MATGSHPKTLYTKILQQTLYILFTPFDVTLNDSGHMNGSVLVYFGKKKTKNDLLQKMTSDARVKTQTSVSWMNTTSAINHLLLILKVASLCVSMSTSEPCYYIDMGTLAVADLSVEENGQTIQKTPS